jgi:hypothetical protein
MIITVTCGRDCFWMIFGMYFYLKLKVRTLRIVDFEVFWRFSSLELLLKDTVFRFERISQRRSQEGLGTY